LRRLVRLYPEETIFQRQLAVAFGRIGKPQEGLEPARKAIDLDSSSANNHNILICTLAQAGRPDEALDYFRQCQTQGIHSHLLERGVGLAYMVKGDYDAAIAAFRRMNSPLELQQEGAMLACGPLVMQGHFAEVSEQLQSGLIADSMEAVSERREAGRVWLAHVHWLMDQPEKARMHASETAQLDPHAIYLPFLGPTAGLAFLLRDTQTLAQLNGMLERISRRWPSTYSNGSRSLCEALLRWATGDSRASESFQEARGLWPDPLALFWVARWQSNGKDWDGALATLGELEANAGTLLRYHFTGLAVLSWIEQARCLRHLSRFQDSLRIYSRVLDHWGRHAAGLSIMSEIHTEYVTLLQGGKE
jgi:pentatricopeptide repeat protein